MALDALSASAFELPTEARGDHARRTARPAARRRSADGRRSSCRHRSLNARFDELPELLNAGDLLVVNVSATLPASVSGRRAEASDDPLRVNFSTPAPDLDQRWWVVELRSADGATPAAGLAGESIELGPIDGRGARLELVAPYATSGRLRSPGCTPTTARPCRSCCGASASRFAMATSTQRWSLSAYQNVYAITPGSAEMPSAGRPFTTELIAALVARGIAVAPICLHTGVSSPERHEPPFAERYRVPEHTARAIAATSAAGGRVIAVGTTVVRALETVVDGGGEVRAGNGWTKLVIDPDRAVRAVDGMITGWHEPEASHLMMLEAIAGQTLLERSYAEAMCRGYLWHEFGDSHLILR